MGNCPVCEIFSANVRISDCGHSYTQREQVCLPLLAPASFNRLLWTRKEMPSLRGAEHPAHKLTEQAVREIRRDYRPGWISYRDLAERYNVSLQLVAQIAKRQAWAWVEDDPSQPKNSGAPQGLFFLAPDQVDAE